MKTKSCRTILLALVIVLPMLGVAQHHKVKVILRGVYDSKVSLSAENGLKFARSLQEFEKVASGQEIEFAVPDSLLPGEFVLDFRYRTSADEFPNPTRVSFFVNKADAIRVHANPIFLKGDSLVIDGDRENKFWKECNRLITAKKQQLGLLQQFVAGYAKHEAKVWLEAVKELNNEVGVFNLWVDSLANTESDLFVSRLLQFRKMSTLNWTKDSQERNAEFASKYFDNFNMQDTLQLRSSQVKQFLANFVNMSLAQAKSKEEADSIVALVADKALSIVAKGHPLVYGYFVDYFYIGLESYGLTKGMEVIRRHSESPNCLTNKKRELARRLAGIKNMKAGIEAPAIQAYAIDSTEEHYLAWDAKGKDYQLVIFYEHDCGHCDDIKKELKTWIQNPDNSLWINIVSIGLDDTHQMWLDAAKKEKLPWTDLYVRGGVNSTAAENYYVLATPSMFVIDKTGSILAFPKSVEEINQFLHGSPDE